MPVVATREQLDDTSSTNRQFQWTEVRGKRNATVKLFMHRLDDYGIVADYIGGSLFGVTSEGGKHWAVAVQFEGDDQAYLCELHRDPRVQTKIGSGGITWISKRMTKQAIITDKKGITTYDFGTVQTTPEELHQMCSTISYNGKDYNLLMANCQHWAQELLHKLGLSTQWFMIIKYLEKSGIGWVVANFIEKHGLPVGELMDTNVEL